MSAFEDQVADVSVTSATVTQTRAGFGTALIAAASTPWTSAPRVRTFASAKAVLDAGFSASDPAYLMAAAMFAQDPAPPTVKIGRRTRAFTQSVVLSPNEPVDDAAAETYAAAVAGHACSFTTDPTPTIAEACTGLAAAINAIFAASAASILATGGASTAGVQTISGTALNGSIGGGAMSPPRKVSLTFSAHANWDATTAVVHGLDADGNVITENFAIPNGGDDTVNGSKFFAKVTSIVIPAQSGTAGTFTAGTLAVLVATATATTVTCAASDAGRVYSYALSTSNLGLKDDTADPGIANDLAEIAAADGDFYGLVLDSNGAAEVESAASWAETNKRLFCYQTADTGCGDPSVHDDVMSTLRDAGYKHSLGWFYPAIGLASGWIAAAAFGNRLPADPGSDTWSFKTIAGIAVLPITDTQRSAILSTPDSTGKNGNLYEMLDGAGATFNGRTASGEWVDVVRGLDWFRVNLKSRIVAAQRANEKIPFTDNGIDILRNVVRGMIADAVRVGLFADAPKATVTAPRAAAVSSGDRSARNLPGVGFSAPLAGAVLYTHVAGTAAA